MPATTIASVKRSCAPQTAGRIRAMNRLAQKDSAARRALWSCVEVGTVMIAHAVGAGATGVGTRSIGERCQRVTR